MTCQGRCKDPGLGRECHCGARLIAVGDVGNVTLDSVEENET